MCSRLGCRVDELMDVENECESGSVESEYAGSEGSYEDVQMTCMCRCLDVLEREQRTFNQIVIHTLKE